MSEEDPNIVVREIRGEKKVGFRGLEYVERDESELRQLVEEKSETIIALHEADDLESPDREWKFGQIIENSSEEEDNTELENILKYSTLNIVQSYDLKLFRNFYRMFPDGDFDKDLPWALYREMLVDKRLDEFHEVYERMVQEIPEHERLRTYEYRVYTSVDEYNIGNILEALFDLGKRHTSSLTARKAAEGVRHVRAMAGKDQEGISEESVGEEIRKNEFSEE